MRDEENTVKAAIEILGRVIKSVSGHPEPERIEAILSLRPYLRYKEAVSILEWVIVSVSDVTPSMKMAAIRLLGSR